MLLVTGCSAAPAPTPTLTPTLPEGVTVGLEQLRSDVSTRTAQVRVTNDSGAAITVAGVSVEDDRFAGPSRRVIADRVSTIASGSSVDVRVQLAPVDCDAADDGTARVVIELVSDAGTTEAVASAADPLGFLERLHARECLAERLADAVTPEFTGFTASPPGEPAALELTLTPAGGGADATVVGVERTNLLDLDGQGDDKLFPLDVEIHPGDTRPVVVVLPVVPARCDPHVVQEDKRGTIFDVRVELDGEPGEIELFVGEELRGRILTWVAQWCGFGGPG